MSRIIGIVKLVLINAAVLILLLVVIEGVSSYLLVGREFLSAEPVAERAHTEYDATLGWINRPNVHLENLYGPGVYLSTNSQRYRNAQDFSPAIPTGKVRIVCSGDSFTLGYGVDNDHTWCQLLAGEDERLQTVNLGQGGYGVDQAYLWYGMNRDRLEHDIVIFAFITYDFRRMRFDSFLGFGKPYLALQDGELTTMNTPVPRRAYYSPWLTAGLPVLRELNTVKLWNRISSRFFPRRAGAGAVGDADSTRAVVARIFADLYAASQTEQRKLVLVYLPMIEDYSGFDLTKRWRRFVADEAAARGYHLVDMVEELRKLPPDIASGMFDTGHRHYTVAGNRFVAETLYRKLGELAAIPDADRKASGNEPSSGTHQRPPDVAETPPARRTQ
jgi:hypothetical protein